MFVPMVYCLPVCFFRLLIMHCNISNTICLCTFPTPFAYVLIPAIFVYVAISAVCAYVITPAMIVFASIPEAFGFVWTRMRLCKKLQPGQTPQLAFL